MARVVLAFALARGAWLGLKWALGGRDPRGIRFGGASDVNLYRQAVERWRYACPCGHDFPVPELRVEGVSCPSCGAQIASRVSPHTVKLDGRLYGTAGRDHNIYRSDV